MKTPTTTTKMKSKCVIDMSSVFPKGRLDLTTQFEKLGPSYAPLAAFEEVIKAEFTKLVAQTTTPEHLEELYSKAIGNLQKKLKDEMKNKRKRETLQSPHAESSPAKPMPHPVAGGGVLPIKSPRSNPWSPEGTA